MKSLYSTFMACILAGAVLSGCASSYNAIAPEMIHYGSKSESNGVVLQYRYDVLMEHNNKKYAKKEKQNHMQLVAVKITNNSDNVLNVPDDIQMFAGDNKLVTSPPSFVHGKLKQGVPIYLLYMLFTPMVVYTTDSSTGQVEPTNSFPLGLILGPGLTGYNMLRAGGANQAFLRDLQTYSLMNRQLKPGETTYALIGINNSSYNPINIKVGTEEARR